MSGDRYVICGQGHTHWGAYGAAGLLLRYRGDGDSARYLLQHRAWSLRVDHPGTWSVPGGALRLGEQPEAGALRETREEAGWLPAGLRHVAAFTDDHGGWQYSTVVMDSPLNFTPGRGRPDAAGESDGYGWFTAAEAGALDLHPGFRESWDRLCTAIAEADCDVAPVPDGEPGRPAGPRPRTRRIPSTSAITVSGTSTNGQPISRTTSTSAIAPCTSSR